MSAAPSISTALNIFNRNASEVAGVFTADGVTLTVQGINGQAVSTQLVQRLQIQYAQNITRLFEVGSTNMYYVGGRAQGQASLDRVIGPALGLCNFYKTYGDVCQAKGRNLQFNLAQSDCSKANAVGGINLVLTSAVIQAVGLGVTANDIIITDMTSVMFASLSC